MQSAEATSPASWFLAAGMFVLAFVAWRRGSAARANLARMADEQRRAVSEGEAVVRYFEELAAGAAAPGGGGSVGGSLAAAAARISGAVSARVFALVAGERLQTVASEGVFPPQREVSPPTSGALRAQFFDTLMRGEEIALGEGAPGEAARTRRTVHVRGSAAAQAAVDPVLVAGAVLAVPVDSGGRLLGVVAVAAEPGGRGFSAEEVRLLEALARHAGVCAAARGLGAGAAGAAGPSTERAGS